VQGKNVYMHNVKKSGFIPALKRGYMDIKDRLKELRTTLGITQVKFAERIAISTSYISEVEGGIKEINERVLRLIIAEFNVNEQWIRSGNGTMFNEDANAFVSEAIGIFKSLDQQFQESTLQMLEVMSALNGKIRFGDMQ